MILILYLTASRQRQPTTTSTSLTTVTPRKTSSNPIIANKQSQEPTVVKKRRAPVIEAELEVVEDSEPQRVRAHARAIGGMEDDEDDTLEGQAAMSSPIKGRESRGSAKVRRHTSYHMCLLPLILYSLSLSPGASHQGQSSPRALTTVTPGPKWSFPISSIY